MKHRYDSHSVIKEAFEIIKYNLMPVLLKKAHKIVSKDSFQIIDQVLAKMAFHLPEDALLDYQNLNVETIIKYMFS